jgi:CheY-like chemotaxis protein
MRELKITALTLLLSTVLFSQTTRLDSLEKAVEAHQGMDKVKALNRLSSELLDGNPGLSEAAAGQALALAQRLNDQVGKAAALDNLGMIYESRLDYNRAMGSFLEALKIRDQLQDQSGKAISRINMGRVFCRLENFTQAEEYLVKALHILDKTGDSTHAANAREILGACYLSREIYGKAQENYLLAMDLKLETGDVEGAAGIAIRLGNIKMELSNAESAISYYRAALDLHWELSDTAQIANDYNQIAMALLNQGAYGEALEETETAMNLRWHTKDTFGLAECHKNLGLIYLKMGQNAKASANFQQSTNLLREVLIRTATPDVYLAIAQGFAQIGNFPKAYENHIFYSTSRHVVLNREKEKALLDLTAKYESEFAAREQQQRIKLLEIENATSEKIKYFLLLIIGLIGGLLATLCFSYRRKKRDNQLLLAKNEEIERQKNEINDKNVELQQKNVSLDLLNKKLVDEMAERENVEKSSFARDRFLATMSHEMRTPLNIIIGLSHILLDSQPRPDQAEQLRTLQYSANDLVVFINDVLDFSKIEAGKLNLEDREFIPAATFQEVSQLFQEKSARKNLQFQFSFDKKIPEKLLGDNARLHQILTYLHNNIFQYTELGFVKTSMELEKLNTGKAMLKITVEGSDGGLGREMLETTSQTGGSQQDFTGMNDGEKLSLAIAKRLVELQNGKLEVETLPGTSTSFIVYLPFKLPVSDEKSDQAKPASDFSHLAGTSILVVEDNKINQLVVAKLLRKLGIEVKTANHGLEALDIYEYEDFDLILMDIQMPEMDGYRTTAEIRTHPNPAKRDVPIIALTASAFLTEKEKAVLFGMNDHVGKPFSPDELLEKISACLAIYRNA